MKCIINSKIFFSVCNAIWTDGRFSRVTRLPVIILTRTVIPVEEHHALGQITPAYEQRQLDLATFRAVPAHCPQVLLFIIVWDTPGKEKVAKWSSAPASMLEGFNEIYAVYGPPKPYKTREKRQSKSTRVCPLQITPRAGKKFQRGTASSRDPSPLLHSLGRGKGQEVQAREGVPARGFPGCGRIGRGNATSWDRSRAGTPRLS